MVRLRTRSVATTSRTGLLPSLCGAVARAVAVSLLGVLATQSYGSNRFTVTDDIRISEFRRLDEDRPWLLSPDGRYFVAVAERGLVNEDRVEDTIWVFSVTSLKAYLQQQKADRPPGNSLVSRVALQGPVMRWLRWRDDSKALMFVAPDGTGHRQLFEVGLDDKVVTEISGSDQDVIAFDERNGHVVYAALDPAISDRSGPQRQSPAMVATGRSLGDILFPPDLYPESRELYTRCELWVVDGLGRRRLENAQTHRPVTVHQTSNYDLTFWISPTGTSILAYAPVKEVPAAWERYKPSDDTPPRRINSGPQDVEAASVTEGTWQFVLIDVSTGDSRSLLNAPGGFSDAYYSAMPSAAWSSDGRYAALSNTFLPLAGEHSGHDTDDARTPCLALADTNAHVASCIERLPPTAYVNGDLQITTAIRFATAGHAQIIAETESFGSGDNGASHCTLFTSAGGNSWHKKRCDEGAAELRVEQDLNHPPVLAAVNKATGRSRALLEPNRRLLDLDLGIASPFHWKDKQGFARSGVLIKPPDFVGARRYPLVIQTHGFSSSAFQSYGGFPSAMAARELAAAGILVLQLGGRDGEEANRDGTAEEAPLAVAGYETAVDSLDRAGMVDPKAVGVVGFSATVYHVVEALTTRPSLFAAAIICDGVQYGYFDYLAAVDSLGDLYATQAISIYGGARPVGAGLKVWSERAPDFNLDRSEAPVRIEAHGAASALSLWEPYAQLRYLHKPVDLIVLRDDEHVLARPSARLASQGGAVDWFRFWLQGYEDPDPAKAEQYKRWRELRKLQVTQNAERANGKKESSMPH